MGNFQCVPVYMVFIPCTLSGTSLEIQFRPLTKVGSEEP